MFCLSGSYLLSYIELHSPASCCFHSLSYVLFLWHINFNLPLGTDLDHTDVSKWMLDKILKQKYLIKSLIRLHYTSINFLAAGPRWSSADQKWNKQPVHGRGSDSLCYSALVSADEGASQSSSASPWVAVWARTARCITPTSIMNIKPPLSGKVNLT